jgi:hypothetical protein
MTRSLKGFFLAPFKAIGVAIGVIIAAIAWAKGEEEEGEKAREGQDDHKERIR